MSHDCERVVISYNFREVIESLESHPHIEAVHEQVPRKRVKRDYVHDDV